MKDVAINEALSALGYSRGWLETGILTDADLKRQFAELAKGEDPHPEHYRYRAISSF